MVGILEGTGACIGFGDHRACMGVLKTSSVG